MEIFSKFLNCLAAVPDWFSLIVLPAILIALAVLFTLIGHRKLYYALAPFIGIFGFTLIASKDGELPGAFVYLGLFLILAALLRLLFLISPVRGKRGKRSLREEQIYRKFRMSLDEQLSEDDAPTQFCGDEQELPLVTAEESGMRLAHVKELLSELKRENLNTADRLEVDVLSRTVEALGNKQLTEAELNTLNDCLASVLKFTAKYKL